MFREKEKEMKNDLALMIKESGLEQTKAQVLLDKFTGYFQIASDWEKKAKAITVTDAGQKAEMQMARTGRLFLREKRIQIDRTRKELKEQSLREGKAIACHKSLYRIRAFAYINSQYHQPLV